MLFFRSEESIDAWCRRRSLPRRPTVRRDLLGRLAVTWSASGLAADSRRPGPNEMRGIFAGLGLDDDFWDPQVDSFG
jgi:hypothetical protein